MVICKSLDLPYPHKTYEVDVRLSVTSMGGRVLDVHIGEGFSLLPQTKRFHSMDNETLDVYFYFAILILDVV